MILVMLVAAALVLIMGLMATIALIARRIKVCAPDELLVVSGKRSRRGPRMQGFTIVRGGRVFPIPLLEMVDSMNLAPIPVSLRLHAARCRGGEEISFQLCARVRIDTEPERTARAARLLLGLSPERISYMATQIIHGVVLELLPMLDASQVREDQVQICQKLQVEAGENLARLGLVCEDLTVEL